ncbi:apolipoprotein C-IV isoform X1 [Mesocricetus auratus]|uniref:Apolipoprotein C-IV n=1 Tax=Mesocricetus auratus TaxID=10036 RepID=A0ABM2WHU6_MESAU|nr:apolipoprotein C-IV isoform X1 [Mesocricetus auratus]
MTAGDRSVLVQDCMCGQVSGTPALGRWRQGDQEFKASLAGQAPVTPESLVPTPSPENSRWSLVRARVMEMVQPLVTRTRDRWQWFWGPGAVQGFVQTYYEDHLKDLGPRTQAWLQSSRDQLLNKTHSLCPRLLCRDGTQG